MQGDTSRSNFAHESIFFVLYFIKCEKNWKKIFQLIFTHQLFTQHRQENWFLAWRDSVNWWNYCEFTPPQPKSTWFYICILNSMHIIFKDFKRPAHFWSLMKKVTQASIWDRNNSIETRFHYSHGLQSSVERNLAKIAGFVTHCSLANLMKYSAKICLPLLSVWWPFAGKRPVVTSWRFLLRKPDDFELVALE